mmetsp:Transcript_3857/g.17064  ORF Transcript_3857/g.17064 Transcript_3857/m.17064 type:complete len:222 (+) Transcript_3857:744-1409(+)
MGGGVARRALVPPRSTRRRRPRARRRGGGGRHLRHRPHRRSRIGRTRVSPHALQREARGRHGFRVLRRARWTHRAERHERAVQAAQLVGFQRRARRGRFRALTPRRLDRSSTSRRRGRDGPQQRPQARVRPGLGPVRGLPGVDEVSAVRVHAPGKRASAGHESFPHRDGSGSESFDKSERVRRRGWHHGFHRRVRRREVHHPGGRGDQPRELARAEAREHA